MQPDKHPPLPFFARAIEGLGDTYLRLSPKSFPLDASHLHEEASRQTGLTDFGDPHYQEGLDVLLGDVRKNVKLNFIGHFGLYNLLLNKLKNRLYLARYRQQHPEVFSQPLPPPLLITGRPRSGTTFLYRLMHEDPAWRSLKLYEIFYPVPPETGTKDRRLAECRTEINIKRWLTPEIDRKHLIRADLPEECMWLLGNTFCSVEFVLEMPVYEYLEWYTQHDRSRAYQEYAQLLQVAQAQAPGKSLLLKAPIHRGSLFYLQAVIPNIRLLLCERDRSESLNSFCSLLYSAQRTNVRELDKHRLGTQATKFFQEEDERQEAFVAEYPERVYRASYEDVRQQPLEVVRDIYRHYGISFPDRVREKLWTYAISHPQHQHGIHRYVPEEFGLAPGYLLPGS